MATAPFGDQFPLADTSLYSSRISEFISRPVNYILTGFKPGYALQASELNEIQEQFFVQQTLSQRCIFNWLTSTISRKPFWNGTTPYSPDQISASDGGNSIIIECAIGWYYIIDKTYTSSSLKVNSGIGYWIYIDAPITSTVLKSEISTNTSNPSKVGLTYQINKINSLDDGTLYDNANASNVSITIPGADRIEFTSFSLMRFTSQTLFSDILTISNSSETYTVKFIDGSLISTITG